MKDALLVGALVVGYVVGAIPVSNIVARVAKGLDLRRVGSGMVTPSNLYRAGGLRLALIAGFFEVVKGTVGPVLVGPGHPWLAALAGALAVSGHNWSPFLKGAGGRGLSTATGALMIVAWPGAALMCGALAVGVLTRRIFPAISIALFALVPLLAVVGGLAEAIAGAIVVTPIGVKTAFVIRRERADKRPTAGS